jgi:hypothetical protein
MLRLGMLSLLLVGVGAVASWIISRRITKPSQRSPVRRKRSLAVT